MGVNRQRISKTMHGRSPAKPEKKFRCPHVFTQRRANHRSRTLQHLYKISQRSNALACPTADTIGRVRAGESGHLIEITRTLGRLETDQVQHHQAIDAAGEIRIFTEAQKLHAVGFDQVHVLAIQHGQRDAQRVQLMLEPAYTGRGIQAMQRALNAVGDVARNDERLSRLSQPR